jgi:iron complex transport system substrate-binding protein
MRVQPAKFLWRVFFCMKKLILIIILFLLGTVPVKAISANTKGTVPKRYISLAPSTTEILFALGLGNEIVGVSSYCNYPQKAKSKEKVGEFSHPNIEKILSLKPDYVFCTGLEQAAIVVELKRQNLNIYVGDPKNMEELLNSIRDIGKITGKEKVAENLIRNMKQEIEEITSRVKLIPRDKRPKVFIEIWHDPLITAGKGSFIDELITLAGGINIAHDTKRAFTIFSPEEVIRRNPDCIILAYMDKEKPSRLLGKRFGWKEVTAVKNNRLYNDINPDLLLRPGPRVTQGLKEIYKRLYP